MVLNQFSLVTNACANDFNRIRLIFPHWLRVFGERIGDFTVVLDRSSPTGRSAALHATTNTGIAHAAKLSAVEELLDAQMKAEPRMRVIVAPTNRSVRQAICYRWFGKTGLDIDRDQGGMPVAAYLTAFESGRERFVLHADCDVLFHEAGWLDAAITLLDNADADMVEPPRHQPDNGEFKVTTRVSMIDFPAFAKKILPMTPHSLDPLRSIHRWLQGRSAWWSLEQMFQKERDAGRLRYVVLSPELGQWLHVARNDEAGLPIMPAIAESVRLGNIPDAQRRAGWDFVTEAWE